MADSWRADAYAGFMAAAGVRAPPGEPEATAEGGLDAAHKRKRKRDAMEEGQEEGEAAVASAAADGVVGAARSLVTAAEGAAHPLALARLDAPAGLPEAAQKLAALTDEQLRGASRAELLAMLREASARQAQLQTLASGVTDLQQRALVALEAMDTAADP